MLGGKSPTRRHTDVLYTDGTTETSDGSDSENVHSESVTESDSESPAPRGRRALPLALPLAGKGQIHDPTNALGGESAILTFFGALNSKSAFPPI